VDYLKKLAIAGAKVVLILTGGSPIALGELEELMHAIVFVWYPGQEGGRAVGDLLFGDVSPSGKLPMTFPKSTSQLPPFKEYGMAGRTYRYANADPLYPFGFGLSYTRFKYSDLQVDKRQISSGESLRAAMTVSNAGACTSAEVVQFYITDLETSAPAPKYSLVGFRRVQLDPGASQRIEFVLTPDMLKLVDDDGNSVLEPGDFRLTIGSCSPGSRGIALGAPVPLTITFSVV
jgi:beta-glucosidase